MTANPPANVIVDPILMKAVNNLATRSERTDDLSILARTFVDNGLLTLLDVTRNQLVYGRRGTGKTHVLKVLQSLSAERGQTIAIYTDLRTLGSSTLFTDESRPLHERLLGLLRDILTGLVNEFSEHTVETFASTDPDRADAIFTTLGELEKQITNSETTTTAIETHAESSESAEGKASISITAPSIQGTLASGQSQASKITQTLKPKIVFPAVYEAIEAVLHSSEITRLVLLLDEWPSIPTDLQPYLAEFLNRALLPNSRITVKIAALEFRSRFSLMNEKGMKELGLELGGDIETHDLDEYYVYDRDPAGTEKLFSDVLYNHLVANLIDETYLARIFAINDSTSFVSTFFTEGAFKELVRAAEGVARDLLQVFARAYIGAWRAKAAHITLPIVTRAASEWYESDKQSNLGESQRDLLRAIIDDVIANKKARSFMVDRDHSDASVLRSLIDQRVVHLIKKGYADKDRPGTRYNIYTLDYGCYVDLKGTKMEPQLEFEELASEKDQDEVVVPFDDNRSIRRIILPPELLSSAE